MNEKPRVFVYEKRELWILFSLGIMVSLFSFTLGIHLGKKVDQEKSELLAEHPRMESKSAETANDAVPDPVELTDRVKDADRNVEEKLNEGLHAEVLKTGVQLDPKRQVDLPKSPSSKNAGATTLGQHHETPAPSESAHSESKDTETTHHEESTQVADQESHEAFPASVRRTPDGRYTLQVGSYPTVKEAKDHLDALEALQLEPFLRKADLKSKGRWFRIYIGGYGSMKEAQKFGDRYRQQHVIDSFVVSKMPEQ